MKLKFSVFSALAITILVAFSSCTKTYTCHCVINYTNAPGLPSSTYSEYNITDTKGNAQSTCREASGVYHKNNTYSVDSCYLY